MSGQNRAVRLYRATRADLGRCLAAWQKGRQVLAPMEQTGEGAKHFVDWALWEDTSWPESHPGVPKTSIKGFFLPQVETMFVFSARRGEADALRLKTPEGHPTPRVLVNVRPCDARSVVLNGLPYAEDPYFAAARGATALVGLTCDRPCRACFCRWVGGSPAGSEGLDIALYPHGDEMLVEVRTELGEKLLEEAGGAPQASDEDAAALAERKRQAEEPASQVPDPLAAMREKSLSPLYEAPFWEEEAEACINCGACTFLCPTCYCFDIQDEVIRGEGRRIRLWDSCMFPLFTLHASGHNPRGQKVQRVRNRFLHKLKYFPDRFGPFSCVGCGRCVRECPVNIDIRGVLSRLLAQEA